MDNIGSHIQSKSSFMKKLQSGFNLVELVIVIVVAGILATVVAPIVMRPFLAYDDTSRRVVLVDAAEAAMRKIAYDVNHAIPNTLRVSGTFLELMPIRGGGRYRYSDDITDDTALTPSAPDSQFQMLGDLPSMPTGARVVVYNTAANLFYPAATNGGAGIITPTTTTVSLTDNVTVNGDEDIISLDNPFIFDLYGTGSPQKRFFLATSPVTYHCDTALRDIRRYEGYSTTVGQPISRSTTPLSNATSSAILVRNVSSCSFSYSAGTSTRAALLTINMGLTINGETINLLHQIHAWNAP
ncbi:MAG: prepilin-type N-terminal cleavage/methylation domain-containing protein [Gammaproteobacteria bacterium]|nr:prepilin-type N-terminal cleavage/methylation domain-containing protein [Gammaproteobacteria bacterium]